MQTIATSNVEVKASVTIPAASLVSAITRTVHCTSKDGSSRYVTQDMLFELSPEGIRLVATNGQRLAYQDIPAASETIEGKIRVHHKGCRKLATFLRKLGKKANVTITIDGYTFLATSGEETFAWNESPGRFPNYRMITDLDYENRASVDLADLSAALVEASQHVTDEETGVTLTLAPAITKQGNDLLIVQVTRGNETPYRQCLPCRMSGKGGYGVFNGRWLAEMVKPLGTKGRIVIDHNDHKSQARFILDGFTCIVMPLATDAISPTPRKTRKPRKATPVAPVVVEVVAPICGGSPEAEAVEVETTPTPVPASEIEIEIEIVAEAVEAQPTPLATSEIEIEPPPVSGGAPTPSGGLETKTNVCLTPPPGSPSRKTGLTPSRVSETKIETPAFDADAYLHDAIEAIRCGQPCVTSDIIDGPHAAEVKARLDALAVAPSPYGPGEFARLNRFLCDCVWGCDLPRLTALIWSPAPAESTTTPSPIEVPDAHPARRLDRRLARLVAVRPDPRVSPGGEDDGAVGLPVSLNAAPGLTTTTTPSPEIAPCCPCSPSSCSSPWRETSPSPRASWTRGSTRTDAPEAAPCRSSSTRRYGSRSASRAATSPTGTPASSSHAMLADAALASLLNRPWTTPTPTTDAFSPWVTLAACPLGPDDLRALADAEFARDRRPGTEADRCPC